MQYKSFLLTAPSNKNAHPKDVTRVQKNQQKKGTGWKLLVLADFIEVHFLLNIIKDFIYIHL